MAKEEEEPQQQRQEGGELKVPEEMFKDVKFFAVGDLDPQVIQFLKDGKAKEVSYNALASHIISEDGDNPEVSESREVFDLPVVKPSWVTWSVRCGALLPVNGFSPESCQLFFGVAACLSQVSSEDRSMLWALITFYGGECRLSLNKKCTHLIVPEPKGEKYECACKRENIKIVTPDWVLDSVSAKTKKDETSYHPRLIIYEEEEEEEEEENEEQDSQNEGSTDEKLSSPASSREGSPSGDRAFSPKSIDADKTKGELMFDDSSDSSPEKHERNLNWTPAEVPQTAAAKRRLPSGKDSGLINLCANVPPVTDNILSSEIRSNIMASVQNPQSSGRPEMMAAWSPAVRTLRNITNNADIQQVNRPSNVAHILQSLSAPTKTLEQQVNHSQQGHANAVLLSQVKLTPETHLLQQQQQHPSQQHQPQQAQQPPPQHHPLLHLQPQQIMQLPQPPPPQPPQMPQQPFAQPPHQFAQQQVHQHQFTQQQLHSQQLQFPAQQLHSQQQMHRPQQQFQQSTAVQFQQQQHALQQQLQQLQQQQLQQQQLQLQQQNLQQQLQQQHQQQQIQQQQLQQQHLQRIQQQQQMQNQASQHLAQASQALQHQVPVQPPQHPQQQPQLQQQQLFGHDPSVEVPEDYFLLGCVFAIADYPEQMSDKQLLATWKRIIQAHGGTVDPTLTSRCTHLLCESQLSNMHVQALREKKRCITAHWLNSVLKKKKMIPPHRALHFPVAFPAGGKPCSQHIISVTGFVDSDRDDLKLMAYLAGAKYTGYLCRSNTVLICKDIKTQCAFCKECGTGDMIFATQQLQEKCQEQNRELYTIFVDLTKAFDTVSREGLWCIMSKFGAPDRFILMVRQFHDSMTARVLDNGEASEAFPVTHGVKQGCVLAPTLFSIMFSAMLTDAFQNNSLGVSLKYRTDGKPFNLQRLQAVTKIKETVLRDLLFADDCALNAGSEQEMHASMDKFAVACDNLGLLINTEKTKVMHQPAPKAQYQEPTITVKGQKLQAVDQFTYLGSTLSRTVTIDIEVNCRIAKTSSAFGRLQTKVWDRRGISLATEFKVY
ncbi:PAX-interacting protein 1 [Varanus komodoensis]|nr:PAX-interacting protein 1 [Varanus komodoensis]